MRRVVERQLYKRPLTVAGKNHWRAYLLPVAPVWISSVAKDLLTPR